METLDQIPAMDGIRYVRVLSRMHRFLKPKWYLEIGTFAGRSLAHAQGNFVAVDPQFRFKKPLAHPAADEMFLFQKTSDDFFASGFVARNGITFDLAFLDGLHHFEVLLRDFINTEKLMTRGGIVAMHDCCPGSVEMTSREQVRGPWTGDVWKTLLILLRHRPDLKIDVAKAAPTGLVIIRGLDPENRDLDNAYDALVKEYQALQLDDIDGGLDGFYREVPLVDPEELLIEIGAASE